MFHALLLVAFISGGASSENENVYHEPQMCKTTDEQGACTSMDNICIDQHELCSTWANVGECDANPGYMLQFCKSSCGMCLTYDPYAGVQQIFDGDDETIIKTQRVIEDMHEYMENTVFADPAFRSVRENCQNRQELCAHWAASGECEANPGYMKIQCAPACQTCLQVDVRNRCPMPDPDKFPDAYQPGELHEMFERIANGEWDHLKTVIHSAPDSYVPKRLRKYDSSSPNVTNAVNDDNVQLGGPWIVTFDNFLSDQEADRLIELGYEEEYTRSVEVGELQFDGSYTSDINDGRTSKNAWCQYSCYHDPTSKNIMERISNVTGVPEPNSEFLQLLKYEPGEYYRTHHDFIDYQRLRPCGPRILTFFLYLSDVEEGGGTLFNNLNITVQPKRGRALLWPSVKDDNLNVWEDKTHHEALPVISGEKFAANSWIHLREFKSVNEVGCS